MTRPNTSQELVLFMPRARWVADFRRTDRSAELRAPAPAIVRTVGWSLVTDGTLNEDQRCCCTSLLYQRSGSSHTTYWYQANTLGDRLLPDDLTLLSRDLAA